MMLSEVIVQVQLDQMYIGVGIVVEACALVAPAISAHRAEIDVVVAQAERNVLVDHDVRTGADCPAALCIVKIPGSVSRIEPRFVVAKRATGRSIECNPIVGPADLALGNPDGVPCRVGIVALTIDGTLDIRPRPADFRSEQQSRSADPVVTELAADDLAVLIVIERKPAENLLLYVYGHN